MDTVEIIPVGELEGIDLHLETAMLIHRSFSEFYALFAERGDALFNNLAKQMKSPGSELGKTFAVMDGGKVVGAFSWYPADETGARQITSLKALLKLPNLPHNIMADLNLFSQTVPMERMKGAYLSRIAIHENAQRRGIGTLLLKAFEKQATKAGFTNACLHVRQANSIARQFYEHSNYSAFCPSEAAYCIMEKSLS